MSDKTSPVLSEFEEMEDFELNLEPSEEVIKLKPPIKDDDYELEEGEIREDEDEDEDEDEMNEMINDETEENSEHAQTVFNTLMNEKDKRVSEIIISNSLKGPLDFSVLQKMGFDCIKKIVFQKRGGITRLQNLPKDLIVLECSQQALTTLGVLPIHLEELDLTGNRLVELDLASTPHLKRLQISDNHLTLLKNIPTDLEELYVDGNYLQELDLVNAQNLKVLHVSRNTEFLSILHYPSGSIVDFQHDNTSFSAPTGSSQNIVGEIKEKKRSISYEEALKHYYSYKDKYEGSRKKCPNCEQTGGLVFSTDGKHLLALCGNAINPCSFKFKLFRSVFKNKQVHKEELQQQLLSIGEEIIRLNLDTVFEYIHETQAAAKFVKLKEKKQLLEMEHQRLTEPVVEKEERENQLNETRRQIANLLTILKSDLAEYKKSKDKVLLERIMDLQVRQYNPLLVKERELLWDYTEAVVFGGNSGLDNGQQYGCRLVHYEKNTYVEDLLLGEPPSVVIPLHF